MTPEEEAQKIEIRDALRNAAVDDIGKTCRKLQGEIDELEASIKQQVTDRQELILLAKEEILRRMNEQGVKSYTLAEGGNFHQRKQTKVSCADWDLFFEQHVALRIARGDQLADIMGCFQRRLSKEYVQTWLENNNDELPPGVNLVNERVVIFKSK